jgi:hypothetical protein
MADTIKIKVAGGASDAAIPVQVNERRITVPRDTEIELDRAFVEALQNSGYDVTVVATDGTGADAGAPGAGAETIATRSGPDDDHAKGGQVDKELPPTEGYEPDPNAAGADEEGEGEQPPAPEPLADESEAFDADAIIAGNLQAASERLDGLTLDQLEQVKAAEVDREVPRKGMIDAIDKAIAAATPTAG